jgi:zinc-ribbon domain
MSSATSIKRARTPQLPVEPRTNAPDLHADGDAAFRPWHFFVLASLVAATAAVVLSRRATPEHLIFISLTIGAAGAAAAAFYRTLAPLAAADAEAFSEPLSGRARAALEREKALVLRSLKELEFDQAMGKLSARDFDEMSGRLRARALSLLKQLDEGGSGYRSVIERELQARMAGRIAAAARLPTPAPIAAPPAKTAAAEPDEHPAGACPECGTVNDRDARFCKRCGRRVA